ncbi:MAG: DUF4249 domain-containing protein [Leeuwenhoekiella sp.]
MHRLLGLFLLGVTLYSCQDVIDVDLPESEPRLVIDALIRVSDQEGNLPVVIQLSTTAPFDAEDVPRVSGAEVILTADGRNYTIDDQGDGVYIGELPNNVISTATIELNVNYNDERYTATAQMQTTVPIDSLSQGTGTLFSGDETEIVVNYTDPAPSRDYYLFDLDFGFYLLSEDSFYQGNSFGFSYFYEDLEDNSTINIKILGIDKAFYDYMNIVVAQTGQDAGGPFEAPPAEVRGNIVNSTNPANYPLGYFAIAQQYGATITTQ